MNTEDRTNGARLARSGGGRVRALGLGSAQVDSGDALPRGFTKTVIIAMFR